MKMHDFKQQELHDMLSNIVTDLMVLQTHQFNDPLVEETYRKVFDKTIEAWKKSKSQFKGGGR
ncbi:hypothetical protein [Bacillus sp. AFS017336]|uniref:hypothetical protein n=1 Tax=Bacillus sp. AFS017336 TaxID=2033489 RepID=UPI000BF03685|nr:hypothetical protein [Bacillus sp. AFS017336]PEL13023.1 hypothetical protein CN601_05920 [Bacillus sp. AFS017336]